MIKLADEFKRKARLLAIMVIVAMVLVVSAAVAYLIGRLARG